METTNKNITETKEPKTLTLEEAKQILKDNWNDGIKCPCCTQFVKLYKRKLTSSMAKALIMIYKYHSSEQIDRAPFGRFGEFFHVENWLKLQDISSSIRGDFPKLRYWGLIEQKMEDNSKGRKPVPGFYRITPLGIQFVKNDAKVKKIAKLFNDTFFGLEGEEIGIFDALKDKFSYEELMK